MKDKDDHLYGSSSGVALAVFAGRRRGRVPASTGQERLAAEVAALIDSPIGERSTCKDAAEASGA
jgi:hypothetical protein